MAAGSHPRSLDSKIQEYIALDANNITLVFDSGNIVNIENMYKCMHYKDTCSSSPQGQNSTCDSQEDFPNHETWTRCYNPKTDR